MDKSNETPCFLWYHLICTVSPLLYYTTFIPCLRLHILKKTWRKMDWKWAQNCGITKNGHFLQHNLSTLAASYGIITSWIVRNPILSCSNNLPISIRGVDRGQSSPTIVGTWLIIVTSVLPKWNRLQETRKWAQPTGCPLSHWYLSHSGQVIGVSQLIFKLREISSHGN